MLVIEIDSIAVDLRPDFSIDFKFINPLFTETGFEDAYSYSFSLPRTSKNKSFLEQKKNVLVSISFSGILIAKGFGSIKSYSLEYSVDFKTSQLNLAQVLSETNLRELEMETIPIALDTDTPIQKIDKWINHMTQTTITDSVDSGSHKFPTILCFDRTLNATSSEATEIRDRNIYGGALLNLYADGVYVKNLGANSTSGWFNSASPCLRIEYLFQALFQKLGIIIHSNELNTIDEFKQLIHFSGLSMDMEEAYSGQNWNVFGLEIDLNKFAPNLNGIELTKLLDELFGVFYTMNNGRLTIRLKKTVISKPALNFSKYCEPLYENEQSDAVNIYLNYDIDNEERWAMFDGKIWYKTISETVLPGFFEPITNVLKTNHEPMTIGSEETKEIKTVSYVPMISFTDQFSPKFPTVDIDDPIENYFQLRAYFGFQNFTAISSHWQGTDFEKGGFEKFFLGLIRGNYSVFRSNTPIQDGFTPPDNYLTGTTVQRPFFTNLNQVDAVAGFEDFTQVFGSCSIYLNDGYSHVDKYLKNYFELIRKADLISKTLILPIHKILEVISWENPNHIIEQRNLSFRGVVKEVSFALGVRSISPTVISYHVQKTSSGQSQFSNDFNDDFTI